MTSCNWQQIIDNIYPADRKVRGILLSHSASVANLATDIASHLRLDIPSDEIETAAMLHDIGIIATDAPGIDCHCRQPYLCHGAVGADMLRAAGVPEIYARVAERHTGAGLTSDEIKEASLPLPPDRTYMPLTLLERLICYADCFYSKGGDGQKKNIERVRKSMDKFGPSVRQRFEKLHEEFGPGNKEVSMPL